MPPPSSSGPVLRWPSSAEVLEQAHQWAQRQAAGHPELEAVGVFGSYGRGDAGVGSDQDLLVYSRQEWQTLPSWNPRLAATLARDIHWLIPPP